MGCGFLLGLQKQIKLNFKRNSSNSGSCFLISELIYISGYYLLLKSYFYLVLKYATFINYELHYMLNLYFKPNLNLKMSTLYVFFYSACCCLHHQWLNRYFLHQLSYRSDGKATYILCIF